MKGKKGSHLWAGAPIVESTTTVRVVNYINYQLLAVMLLKLPNEQLSVAVDHNQQRTLVKETLEPIDWPLLPYLTGQ